VRGVGAAPKISVIIPAFNEERALPRALELLRAARARLPSDAVEVCVVDNRSTDWTAAIAAGAGARVIREPRVGIANARNAGALAARGDVLVFIDADAHYREVLLARIAEAMADPHCAGPASTWGRTWTSSGACGATPRPTISAASSFAMSTSAGPLAGSTSGRCGER
jgi:glycosyltransferase involved in cell wall biosynthesis